jgi:hypothetical protein
MVRSNPILGMRAPMRPTPRKHLLPAEVTKLLQTAAAHVHIAEAALATDPHNRVRWEGLFVAEQTRLLVRVAADTAARRGELATLRLSDPPRRMSVPSGAVPVIVQSFTTSATSSAARTSMVSARIVGPVAGSRRARGGWRCGRG